MLENVVSIKMPSEKITDESAELSELQLIPYYAWNNRGDGSMIVWLPSDKDMVQYADLNIARGGKYSMVTASSTNSWGSLTAISDPRRPSSSVDRTIQPWISDDDESEWLEIRLKEAQQIRSIGLYWFDDNRKVKVPESWKIQYLKNENWADLNIYVTDHYSSDKDEYNVVHPGSDVVTKGLKILIKPQSKTKVGVLDVDVEYENIGL